MKTFLCALLAISIYAVIGYLLFLLTKAVGFIWIIYVLAAIGCFAIVTYLKFIFGPPFIG